VNVNDSKVRRDNMSAFSASEDKALLLLVVAFQDSKGQIAWDKVIVHLVPTTKTTEEYQERLKYLMTEDTRQLCELPATYTAGTSLHAARHPISVNRSVEEIYLIIEQIFGHLTRADVLQPSGQLQLNAGEIAPVGVTAFLEKVDITSKDVFVDIGSGSGSILAQVVLQTPVLRSVGLEIRADLAKKSKDAIEAARSKYPRLLLAKVIKGDVKAMSLSVEKELMEATIVYSNNVVFSSEDNLALKEFICVRPSIRVVLVSQKFCARCSASCADEFCTTWEAVQTIQAKACWKDAPVDIFMYKHKSSTLSSSTLSSFLTVFQQ
jgi:Histone methylation protein DOT1